MDNQGKVIWCEGMFLQPHHFQQQDRYWQAQLHAARRWQPHLWGFTRLRIDEAQLMLGVIALIECAGVMPDGTAFDLTDRVTPLAALRVGEESAGKTLVLALPLTGREALESRPVNSSPSLARYHTVEKTVADSITPEGEAILMQLGELNLLLAQEEQVRHSHCFLTVTRVEAIRPDGSIVLDEGCIPPVLHYRCSPRLARCMDDFVGRLHQRQRQLRQKNALAGSETHEGAGYLLFLLSLGRALALLTHLNRQKDTHPETLFRELLALAGEWQMYAAQEVQPLPDYSHRQPERSFIPLFALLQSLLTHVVRPTVFELTLRQGEFGIYYTQITDMALLRSARLILAVKAALPADALRDELPARIKVGAGDRIRDMVNLQLPGASVTPLQTLPHDIPHFNGYQYFLLDEERAIGAGLTAAGGLAVHVAGEFPEGKLMLWALAEGEE